VIVLGVVKKGLKRLLGKENFKYLSGYYQKMKPKQVTEKPVAFMLGFSKWKHQHMQDYLSEYSCVFIEDKEKVEHIISQAEGYQDKVFFVWGYKDRKKVKQYAEMKSIPYYRVEDGFIRSIQLGAEKSVPLSICIDSKVLYYDATQPSDLEDLLNTYDFKSDSELMERATKCISLLKDLNISKYNNVNQKNIEAIYGEKTKKRILVVGQVEDDQSIKRGCAKTLTNNDLVWIAKTENPDAEIIYKPHPDVLFGKRAMQSNPNDVKEIAKVITEPLSLTDAFETIDHVYTITSLSGFEALLRGIPVTTIGAPFYSGWGLTDDRQEVTRRKRKLTVEEIFAAAYILYPRYMNPFTKEKIQIEDAIDLLTFLRGLKEDKETDQNKNSAAFLMGFHKTQLPLLKTIFKEENFIFINSTESIKGFTAQLEKYTDRRVYVWKGKQINKLINAASEKNIPIQYIDEGLLPEIGDRSVKLPISVTIDNRGYFNGAEQNSDLIEQLNTYDFKNDPNILSRAETFIALFAGLAKVNDEVETDLLASHPEISKKKVLVLGQSKKEEKKNEAYISNIDLIWIAKTENPDAEVLFKPHSNDLLNGLVDSSYLEEIERHCEAITDYVDVLDIPGIERVYTFDSNEGFEVLLMGKTVTTFGTPFYAGWGLSDDRKPIPKRVRKLSLTEFAAGALILYPTYLNPFSKEIISPEEALLLYSSIKKVASERRRENLVKEQSDEDFDWDQLEEEDEETTEEENDSEEIFIPADFDIMNEEGSKIGVMSKGIKDIPALQSFLKGELIFNPEKRVKELNFIAGWGMKPSAKKALEFCKKHNIPYLGLEDGFLRSVGLGVDGSPPLSICIDDVGIYYDATRPSRLENILNSDGWESDTLLRSSQKAMDLIRSNFLSKYNHAPMIDPSIFKDSGKERVLVVDQTLGDMSITLGLANQDRFKQMYQKAKQDNPNADIYIKTHPDVISGKKQGNLTADDVDQDTMFIYDDCNPLSLLEHVDKVYVVTSQFGFEALMLGKEVHCFGLPFYAGWGITKDQLKTDRRTKVRSVKEVFAAAYILYPRYINPETNKPGTIFDVITYIAENKEQELELQRS
jgi:capsule polysaccharide export protein KpsC/LpsZ